MFGARQAAVVAQVQLKDPRFQLCRRPLAQRFIPCVQLAAVRMSNPLHTPPKPRNPSRHRISEEHRSRKCGWQLQALGWKILRGM
jgi:hypothetical protein